MSDSRSMENDFLQKIKIIIEQNISNEQFGVSELASEMGMSRSNLLRKVKSLTNLSVSRFIRQLRLEKAMEMLQKDTFNVSEISFKVGFSSTSYFIKCFRELYGYSPGETANQGSTESLSGNEDQFPLSHQLAAIMFTDIQGYTATMQKDEVKAVEFRNRHREVFNAAIKKFNGKILQYYGDGTLSTFPSAIDAVKCGIELQLAFREGQQIPVRIGIHSGDIIYTKDDIIGDSVNVASRIESMAAAGSVLISDKVYDEVKNQPEIQCRSMGVFELKNVSKSLELFAITNPGLLVPDRSQVRGKLKGKLLHNKTTKKRRNLIKWLIILVPVILLSYLLLTTDIFQAGKKLISSPDKNPNKKSIAVLPFINDSDDSTNVYIINGLMESILNNLQKIEDLRVISRTSVEKYRNNLKTIPEISEELDVMFFVEGSGQKIGDKIMLNVQLIEGKTDKHLWAGQYNREAKDIFKIQSEVAKNIAGEIQVVITPEEEKRIEKIPTENLIAYDYFLKALDLLYKGNSKEAIIYYKKALQHDNEFARAYAGIAIAYYYMDVFQAEKQYADSINAYADKALLYDPKLPQSLFAKGLFYILSKEYDLALPYLETGLEYNPNSALIINTLSDFYTSYIPNTEKYLEYALKGIRLDIAAHDSTTASYIYLHLSNALIQSGFVDEAELYINKSIDYDRKNLFSEYVKAYIILAKNKDFNQCRQMLIKTLNKDTTRLDVMQETGKICYFMRDYESAYEYYKKFTDLRKAYMLDIYKYENAKIGLVFSNMGQNEESDKLFNDYKEYAENDNSIYKDLNLAVYYSWKGKTEKALNHLKLFSKQDNFFYWIILFLEIDPLVDNIKDHTEFKKILKELNNKFNQNHERIEASLKEKGLL